jgi:hypothetical protein
MPVISIDDSFARTVVATNGVLQSVTLTSFPTNGPWEQPQYDAPGSRRSGVSPWLIRARPRGRAPFSASQATAWVC